MNNRFALFLAAGVALLGGLFVAFKPKPGPEVAAEGTPASAIAPTPVPAPAIAPIVPPPQPKRFELVVKDGRLASGPRVLSAREGESLVLQVTSDKADELHLHGYDLELKLEANVPGTLNFIASRSGRFEYELHKAHADLGALEVQPQ